MEPSVKVKISIVRRNIKINPSGSPKIWNEMDTVGYMLGSIDREPSVKDRISIVYEII